MLRLRPALRVARVVEYGLFGGLMLMDIILGAVLETLVYLFAYLVDWLRWWRFIVSVLIAAAASVLYFHLDAASNLFRPLIALAIAVVGVTAGSVWEYRTRQS